MEFQQLLHVEMSIEYTKKKKKRWCKERKREESVGCKMTSPYLYATHNCGKD